MTIQGTLNTYIQKIINNTPKITKVMNPLEDSEN
jgi:hypothetical protein